MTEVYCHHAWPATHGIVNPTRILPLSAITCQRIYHIIFQSTSFDNPRHAPALGNRSQTKNRNDIRCGSSFDRTGYSSSASASVGGAASQGAGLSGKEGTASSSSSFADSSSSVSSASAAAVFASSVSSDAFAFSMPSSFDRVPSAYPFEKPLSF